MKPDLQNFLQAWTGGSDVPDAEQQRLLHRLEIDPTFRAECVEEIRLLGMIKVVQTPGTRWLEMYDALGLSTAAIDDPDADDLACRVLRLVQAEPRDRMKARLPFWRPITAAAAGLVIGLFSASMVFGFAGRSLEKVVSLLQESFESGPAPLVKGVPQILDQWSGDLSEIVGEQQGVKPVQGTKMIRMLRSDFEGRTVPRPSRQGDLMRVFDARPFLKGANGGDVVVSLWALFNTVPFPKTESYDGMVTIYALGADTELRGATEDSVKKDALAFSVGERRSLDHDPTTWQPASTRLLLPPGTAVVLLKLSIRRMPVGEESLSSLPDFITFSGHFIDDVRASISIRHAAPIPRRQTGTQLSK